MSGAISGLKKPLILVIVRGPIPVLIHFTINNSFKVNVDYVIK